MNKEYTVEEKKLIFDDLTKQIEIKQEAITELEGQLSKLKEERNEMVCELMSVCEHPKSLLEDLISIAPSIACRACSDIKV